MRQFAGGLRLAIHAPPPRLRLASTRLKAPGCRAATPKLAVAAGGEAVLGPRFINSLLKSADLGEDVLYYINLYLDDLNEENVSTAFGRLASTSMY